MPRQRSRPRLIEPARVKVADTQKSMFLELHPDAADMQPVREDRLPHTTGACWWEGGRVNTTDHLRLRYEIVAYLCFEGGARLPYTMTMLARIGEEYGYEYGG